MVNNNVLNIVKIMKIGLPKAATVLILQDMVQRLSLKLVWKLPIGVGPTYVGGRMPLKSKNILSLIGKWYSLHPW